MSGEKGEYYRKIFYKLFDSFLFCFFDQFNHYAKKIKYTKKNTPISARLQILVYCDIRFFVSLKFQWFSQHSNLKSFCR